MPVVINGTTGVTTPGLDASGTNKFATTIGVGGATPSASGAGVTFPATQSASSDANTLDDYEEGTWTATMVPASGFSPTNNTVTGRYTKIGNVVVVMAVAQMTVPSSLGSYANDSTNFAVLVQGLPFTVTSAGGIQGRSAPVIGVMQNIGTTSGYIGGHGSEGTTEFSIFQNKDSGSTRTSPNLFVSTNVSLHFQFTYTTST